MRHLVVGDIHGGFRALKQVLERAKFNPAEDHLISLGDVADGWPEVKECFEYLVSLPHMTLIIGNHDDWFLDWAVGGDAEELWTSQGGQATLDSYGSDRKNVPDNVIGMLRAAPNVVRDDLDRVFVHGGIEPEVPLGKQKRAYTLWDRNLLTWAFRKHQSKPDFKYGGYKEIYVGHTATTFWGKDRPVQACNVIAMDTGGGWEGKLSVMDIDTKEVWQSDDVGSLYPGVEHGRMAKKGRFMYFEEF